MGRGPRDSESAWAGLGKNDARDLAKLAADLGDQCLTRQVVRFALLLALAQQRFDARSSHPDQPRGAAVEAASARLTRLRPGSCNTLVEVVLRAVAKAAIDQPKRVADAGKPRHGLGIIGPRFGLMLWNQVEHAPGLSPAGLTNC